MHHEPEIPAYLTSRLTLQVRFCETDLMGIVHHANYLTYFEAGRVDWLHRRGLSYDTWVKQGVHLPVIEARLRYRKAARFDDVLVVETTCALVKRATVRFDYRILRDREILCEGDTLLACVGDTLAPKRIPALMAEMFRSPEKEGAHPGHHHKVDHGAKGDHAHAHGHGAKDDHGHDAHRHDAHGHAHGHGAKDDHGHDAHRHDAHGHAHGHDGHSPGAHRPDSR